MDPFEMFKIVQDVYIAGLRAQAQAADDRASDSAQVL